MSFAADLFPFRRSRSNDLLRPWPNSGHFERSPTLSELMSTESESSDHTIVITAPVVVARPVPTNQGPVELPPPQDSDSIAYGIKCWAITTFWSVATMAGFYFFSRHHG